MHPKPLVAKRRDRGLSLALTALERLVDVGRPGPALPLDPPPRRIVVLRGCCLGDTLLATPLVGALRRAYPAAHIIAAVGRWSRPAVAGNPDLDGLLDLEGVGTGRVHPDAYLRVVRRLRAGRFDLALVLERTPVLTVLPALAGIPLRAGIDSAGRGFALNVRVPWTAVEHEAQLFLRVGEALGIAVHDAVLRFIPTADAASQAQALWTAHGLDGLPVAALAPGGGRNPGMTLAAKHWPPERYAALAGLLSHRLGLRVILTGDMHDRETTAAVRRAMDPATAARTIDLAGTTSLDTLGALLGRCVLFVGNDSGPTHLAAATGIPVVAIFGPTDPAVYRPYSPLAVALRGPHGQNTCEVSVDEVAAAAESLLAQATT